MKNLESLYLKEDRAHLVKTWWYFPFLDPNFSFLKRPAIRSALKEGNSERIFSSLKFSLFPDMDSQTINEKFSEAINKGVGFGE